MMPSQNAGVAMPAIEIVRTRRSIQVFCFKAEIVPNGIAHLSGLVRPNDRIIAINDQSIRSATTQSQIVEMLKGAAGTEVKLTLLTPNYLHPRHNRDPGATVPVKRDANEPSAGGCVVM